MTATKGLGVFVVGDGVGGEADTRLGVAQFDYLSIDYMSWKNGHDARIGSLDSLFIIA